MNAKLIELAERRAALVAKAATQRAELSQALGPWRRPLAGVEQGLMAVRYIRSHPALLVGGIAFVAALRPWGVVKWLQRAWLVWHLTHEVQRILPGFSWGAWTGRGR